MKRCKFMVTGTGSLELETDEDIPVTELADLTERKFREFTTPKVNMQPVTNGSMRVAKPARATWGG